MDNDQALAIEKAAQRLVTYREELVDWLQEALEDTLFSNRTFIRPSHLKQIAVAEADAFLAFLKNEDTTAVRVQGAKRAEEGVGRQAVLRVGATLRRFCHTRLEGELLQAGLAATDVYTNTFLEGFIEASETIILAEQERIRAALQRALSRYTLQLQTAAEVSRAATSILDLNEMLTTSVEIIRERFDFYYVGLFLVDESGEWAVLRAGTGEASREMLRWGHKLKVGGESTIGWCIAHGQARTALDVGKGAIRFDNSLLPETRSEVVLPLISRGRVIGAMTLQRSGVAAFGDEDITTLQTTASQLANAIENARLFEETTLRLEEMTALYQTSLDITAQLGMTELLKSIVERAVTLLQAEGGGIYIYDPQRQELRLAIGHGHTDEYVGTILKLGEGMAGQVFQTGQPLIVDDYRTWEGRAPVYEADQPFTSMLEVPLKWQDRIIGVLAISTCVQKRTFNHDDLWLTTLFANQAAVAIENARLYETEQDRRLIAEALREMAGIIGSTLELNEVLHLVLEQLRKVIDYNTSSIMMLEGDRLQVIAVEGFTDPEEVLQFSYTADEVDISWEAIQKKQALVVANVTQDPRWTYEPQTADVRAWIGAPLIADGEVIGLLTVDSYQVGKYSQDDAQLVMTFASQAAVAIKNARIYEKEQKRAVQLAVVSEVAQRAASILDMDRLLQEVVGAIQQGFNYYNVSLSLLDEAAGELEVQAIAGGFADLASPDYRQGVGVGMAGWTAETGQPLLANDVSQEPRYIPGFLEEPLTRSELCVPLKLAGQIIGVLDVQDTQLNAFDETDLLAMETLADQIAVAIENARLFRETKRRFEEMIALYQTSLDITAQLGMTELQKSILKRLVTLLGAEGGGISTYDPEREELRLVIGYGRTEEYVGTTLKPGEGMAGKVFQTGEPFIVDDYHTWEGRAPVYKAERPFTTLLQVPLKWHDRIIGVLSISADVQKRTFNQDDVWLATLFANQAAVAIENARLYQQTDEKLQTRVKELAALYAIAKMMNRSLDLDTILQLALDSALEVAGMNLGGILLLDPSINDLFLRAHRGGSPEFIRAISQIKADEGLMPRMLKSAMVVDDLSKLRKDRCMVTEREGFQSMVSIPLQAKESTLGVMVIASRSPRTLAPEELKVLAAIGNQVGVAVDRANLQAQELRAAILEERQHMAQQMHDDIAQTLGYLGLQVDSVMGSSSLAQNVEVQAKLEEIRKAIEDAYERVYSSIMRLREDVPGHFDLGAALPEIINEFEKQTGCRVESRVDEDQLPHLSPSVAFQATYIIREALTNVRKHSGADCVHLTLQGLEDGRVEVTIQDNGRGFDPDSEQQSGGGGFGLRFMRERAGRVGGSVRIESGPGQGSRVVVSLPSAKGG